MADGEGLSVADEQLVADTLRALSAIATVADFSKMSEKTVARGFGLLPDEFVGDLIGTDTPKAVKDLVGRFLVV